MKTNAEHTLVSIVA